MARQAWNDAEELNRLFSIVEMCHFSFKLFPMNFFPIKRIFALVFFFFLLIHALLSWNLTLLCITNVCVYIYMHIYIYIYMHSMSLFAHIFDF